MKQSNKRTVAIYLRVAREDDTAMEMQRNALIQFAIGKGYVNPVCYADNGVSGLTLNRPAFAELVTDIKMGNVKAVIVKDFSRISRNYIEAGTWLEDCRKAGIEVISMSEGNLTATGDGVYKQFHQTLAAYAKAKGGKRK